MMAQALYAKLARLIALLLTYPSNAAVRLLATCGLALRVSVAINDKTLFDSSNLSEWELSNSLQVIRLIT